jgi:hypothetical protein
MGILCHRASVANRVGFRSSTTLVEAQFLVIHLLTTSLTLYHAHSDHATAGFCHCRHAQVLGNCQFIVPSVPHSLRPTLHQSISITATTPQAAGDRPRVRHSSFGPRLRPAITYHQTNSPLCTLFRCSGTSNRNAAPVAQQMRTTHSVADCLCSTAVIQGAFIPIQQPASSMSTR